MTSPARALTLAQLCQAIHDRRKESPGSIHGEDLEALLDALPELIHYLRTWTA